MPIYAYKCESCGHGQDVLQKISDPVLTQCPACGASSYRKQVTAAGFQLKGSGWYVTDFRGGSGGTSAPAKPAGESTAATGGESGGAAAPAAASSGGDTASTSGSSAAGGCGTSCACH